MVGLFDRIEVWRAFLKHSKRARTSSGTLTWAVSCVPDLLSDKKRSYVFPHTYHLWDRAWPSARALPCWLKSVDQGETCVYLLNAGISVSFVRFPAFMWLPNDVSPIFWPFFRTVSLVTPNQRYFQVKQQSSWRPWSYRSKNYVRCKCIEKYSMLQRYSSLLSRWLGW